jgi:hypothetical protein
VNQTLDIPSDYSLPNLYYFTSDILKKIRKQLEKQILILNKAGFEECHFPFLVPRSILLYYEGIVFPKKLIKVYSGKDRRSHAFLRPDGIFSQGLTLVKKIIKSHNNLPLKLFEISPGYLKTEAKDEWNIFESPEQSFSIQGGLFTEYDDGEKYLEKLFSDVLNEFSIAYTTRNLGLKKSNSVEYVIEFRGEEISVIKSFNFGQEIPKKANIYFFNKNGSLSFPFMYTFSLSQNIYLIKFL